MDGPERPRGGTAAGPVREVRRPDLVFAGWLVACTAGWRFRRRPALATGVPIAYLGAAAATHVSTAFVLERGRKARFAGAVALDMAMLGAYFTGRKIGTLLLMVRRFR